MNQNMPEGLHPTGQIKGPFPAPIGTTKALGGQTIMPMGIPSTNPPHFNPLQPPGMPPINPLAQIMKSQMPPGLGHIPPQAPPQAPPPPQVKDDPDGLTVGLVADIQMSYKMMHAPAGPVPGAQGGAQANQLLPGWGGKGR